MNINETGICDCLEVHIISTTSFITKLTNIHSNFGVILQLVEQMTKMNSQGEDIQDTVKTHVMVSSNHNKDK